MKKNKKLNKSKKLKKMQSRVKIVKAKVKREKVPHLLLKQNQIKQKRKKIDIFIIHF